MANSKNKSIQIQSYSARQIANRTQAAFQNFETPEKSRKQLRTYANKSFAPMAQDDKGIWKPQFKRIYNEENILVKDLRLVVRLMKNPESKETYLCWNRSATTRKTETVPYAIGQPLTSDEHFTLYNMDIRHFESSFTNNAVLDRDKNENESDEKPTRVYVAINRNFEALLLEKSPKDSVMEFTVLSGHSKLMKAFPKLRKFEDLVAVLGNQVRYYNHLINQGKGSGTVDYVLTTFKGSKQSFALTGTGKAKLMSFFSKGELNDIKDYSGNSQQMKLLSAYINLRPNDAKGDKFEIDGSVWLEYKSANGIR